jgi:hypothetical protein
VSFGVSKSHAKISQETRRKGVAKRRKLFDVFGRRSIQLLGSRTLRLSSGTTKPVIPATHHHILLRFVSMFSSQLILGLLSALFTKRFSIKFYYIVIRTFQRSYMPSPSQSPRFNYPKILGDLQAYRS